MSSHSEPTTQRAAGLLDHLLDSGEITHREVGRHRRVRLADLQEYRRRDDAARRRAADALVELTKELGLYP